MLKTIRDMLVGAFVAAAVSAALAVTGQVPGTGLQLIDGAWLNALAGGTNYAFQSGIVAAGTNQATAFQLPAGIVMFEVDTTASSTGVALPQCVAGTQLQLRNAGANSLNVFGSATVNGLTAANDTINGTAGSTAYVLNTTTQLNGEFFCAKNGAWSALRGGT